MEVSQVLFNILTRASELALIGISLTLVYDLLDFASFAQNEFATAGAYLTFFFKVGLGLNLFLSAALAVILTGFLGMLTDRAIFRWLRESHASIRMVASIGLALGIRSLVQVIWGGQIQDYGLGAQPPLMILGANVTPIRIVIVVVAAVAMLGFHFFLHRTDIGRAIRATSDNRVLAEASGIDTERVVLYVWFLACAFAAIGGVLIGLETQLRPNMGVALLLVTFCVVILGGIGNIYGAVVGALIFAAAENIGLAINIGGIQLPVRYKPGVAFVVLILTLLIRPRGVLGRKEA
ncbi:MAG TPA: branched-chain amino acid ABC transporter permease [Anaerolineae bacterium]|nr:branched-chain amino acid ABC transporter permease [Anaerolineae bacterium]